MIITRKEFNNIKAGKEGEEFYLKVDFGLRKAGVKIERDRAVIDGKYTLDLKEKIKDNFCYLVDDQGLKEAAFFSSHTNRFYKLIPTGDWPSFSIGSVPMHKLLSPAKDTRSKVSFLKPHGQVLDTCMGLGYTAILSAKKAEKVITFERDENVVELAKINPLSAELFSSGNIEIRQQDVAAGIEEFKDDYFDCIIHDPPTFKISPELFSAGFYVRLRRILKKKGRFFHYTPLYKIKRGYNFPSKVKGKLKTAGFEIAGFSEEAGGFLCIKPR